jgi:hypothetical protein
MRERGSISVRRCPECLKLGVASRRDHVAAATRLLLEAENTH